MKRKYQGTGTMGRTTGGRAYPLIRSVGMRVAKRLRTSGGYLLRKAAPSMIRSLASSSLSYLSRSTSTAQKIQKGYVSQDGTGGSISKTNHGYRKPYLPTSVLNTLAPYVDSANAQSQLISTVGLQNFSGILAIQLTSSQLSTMMSRVVPAGATNRMILTKIHSEMLISNAQTGNVNITLYDWVARRDITTANAQNPATAWSTGITDESGTGATVVGALPFDSQLFNTYYKVVKVTKFLLGAGAVHRHVVDFAPNRFLNQELIQNTTYGIQGLTHGTLVVTSGMPANDSVTSTQVRLGSSTINVISSWEAQYKFPQNNSTKIFQTNALSTSFTVQEEIISTGGGGVVQNVVA